MSASEPGCSRPTQHAPPAPGDELLHVEDELSFESDFAPNPPLEIVAKADTVDLDVLMHELDGPEMHELIDDAVTAHGLPADPEVYAALAAAEEKITQLQMELREEREQRFGLEERLEVMTREVKDACDARLQDMSCSYHETLAALRRAYEQRLQRKEAVAAN